MKKTLTALASFLLSALLLVGVAPAATATTSLGVGRSIGLIVEVSVQPASTTVKTATVTASALNVRKGPGTSYAKLSVVYKNKKYTVLETKNGWHKITYASGKTGWISGSYVKITTSTSSASASSSSSSSKQVQITGGSLNVRKGPGTSYAKLGVVKSGQKFTYHETKNGWYRITYNGSSSAWVSGNYSKVITTSSSSSSSSSSTSSSTFIKINTSSLNVRKGPGTSYARIGSAVSGQVFQRLETKNGWHKITFDGTTGWISGSYTTTATQAKPGWTAWPSNRPKPYSGTYHALNGNIPNEMCVIPFMTTHKVHCRAVNDLVAFNNAYKATFGTNLPIDTWKYSMWRSTGDQKIVQQTITTAPVVSAPGKSPHGWGLAIDFLEGEKYGFGSTIHNWLKTNGPKYGWEQMPWHRVDGKWKEYWHFDYVR